MSTENSLTADEPLDSLAEDVLEDARVFDEDVDFVTVCRRLDLSFDGRISSDQTVVLAQGIASARWQSATLVVVGHKRNTWRTNATLTIAVKNEWPCPEQPELTFAGEPVGACPPIGDSTAMPSCTTSALSVDLGGWVRVIASWSQGTVAATLAQTVTLSVFIVGRPA